MINGSSFHEEVQFRPNDLQEVLEATQEEVWSHQPVQGAVEVRYVQPMLYSTKNNACVGIDAIKTFTVTLTII